jgi:anti-anti-sigma factor
MNPGQIHYAVVDDRAFLKLAGTIRYPLSQRLNLAVGRMFAKAKAEEVVVDLQAVEFIDSTCLGLLARVATRCLELGCETPVIVSTQPEVNRLLRSMGFDHVFVLITDPSSPTAGLADAAELTGVCRRPDPRVVLDAHRALCEINDQNRHLFQNVIEQLESDGVEGVPGRESSPKPTPF